MSSIKSVNTINKQIELLNSRFAEMTQSAKDFTAFLFDTTLFDNYGKYHTLLMDFTNKLITKTPVPNAVIPQAGLPPMTATDNQLGILADLLKNNGKSMIEGFVILGSIIAMTVLAGIGIVPYIIPVVWTPIAVGLFCAPSLIAWVAGMLKKKDEDDLPIDSTNPSEWISHDLQIISDLYDGIRILIKKQDVRIEQLPISYRKMDPALYSRAAKEKEFFPTEALGIIKKIVTFSTTCYYELMDDLISHLPVSPPQPQTPQMGSQ
jgi:hypothetical protein